MRCLSHLPTELYPVQQIFMQQHLPDRGGLRSATQQNKRKRCVLLRSQRESADEDIHTVARLPTPVAEQDERPFGGSLPRECDGSAGRPRSRAELAEVHAPARQIGQGAAELNWTG
jgi:hypothetical protein